MTTVEIPTQVSFALREQKYRRASSGVVTQALERLGASHELFESFFKAYEGSFWSAHLGVEFLDLTEGQVNILNSTEFCRVQFGFQRQYFVLTAFSTGQVLVLDADADLVYQVDFEGGEKLLPSGSLSPTWKSFEMFLIDYFNE